MPTLSPRRPHVRLVLSTGLVLLLITAAGLSLAYRRAMRQVDRRIAHSRLYAARPRPELVSSPAHSGPHRLATVALHPQRRVAAYDALPPQLVEAVVAIEDRSFFEHSGVNYMRTARCAVQDTLTAHMGCGGSTITQQLARAYFLSPRKTFRRKILEILIARRLEQRLTKQQIFAMYAAEVDLGQTGPTDVKGFAAGSRAYFGKDLRSLTLAQNALLAGIVQAPNFDNPNRHPDRARARRNLVLDAMVATGAITPEQARRAKDEPLSLADATDDAVGFASVG